MKLTLDEYSKHFKMSKEMLHSKLREKKLHSIVENGTTYIVVANNIATYNPITNNTSSEAPKKPARTVAVAKPKVAVVKPKPKTKTTVSMVISLYQQENKQLKDKIMQLETKVDKLIDDKEQMLRDEMNKIEQVYSTKDEQLKSILELINVQMQTQTQMQTQNTIHEVETLDKQISNTPQDSTPQDNTSQDTPSPNNTPQNKKPEQVVELKEYLKTLDLESHQKKVIKKRFITLYGSDVRVIQQNGNIFLDFSKYDYSDLLEY